MAWSQADADFWASGRTDVTAEVIGSQLLWEAARNPAPETALAHDDLPLTYLGQLHGAELPRRDMARSTGAFCRATGATYRPHPAERDKLSRAQHAIWRRQGITIDDGAVPLASLNTPVVSAFSTGVLEASAKGIPAWVHYDNPPAWLTEFWQRYGMAQFGAEPTPRRLCQHLSQRRCWPSASLRCWKSEYANFVFNPSSRWLERYPGQESAFSG
ncbi:hypothetical protein [Ornithinimicrobium sp. INDO-MA30-4]|uniref:hypothetical protein n=1 Tax=Ornithinimicrobium sp. INDO-MA30-4 TaxID=2908651 RepID=UPI001F275B12|nr:hypothetical protein [Ornithinimicrobium sp. INDO-MA30-4]UJH69891.1 hypothetical protein L0A91_11685 [Ornithinimicrobium sp. INDO-MA30-4]